MTMPAKKGRGNRDRYNDDEFLREIALHLAYEPVSVAEAFRAAVEINWRVKSLNDNQRAAMLDRLTRKFNAKQDELMAEARNRPKTRWGTPAFTSLLTCPELPEVEQANSLRQELSAALGNADEWIQATWQKVMSDTERTAVRNVIRAIETLRGNS